MAQQKNLTHIGRDGRPAMVDVGEKPPLLRTARACGSIVLQKETINLIRSNEMKKGNVLISAELAGVQAAKKTSDLIPLCHNIFLSNIQVKATLGENGVSVQSTVSCTGQTGVEMEALTAVSTALLTVYDMCKAVDKNMVLESITLLEKTKKEQ